MMRWNLNGGVAVITGAASGIGRALAKRLARENLALALVDVDAAGLQETLRQVATTANRVSLHFVDVADARAVEQLSAQVRDQHGQVNLLVNNAGVALFGTVEEISLAEFDWLMRINFWGVVHGVKYFLPLLRRQPRAHIANVSSLLGAVASAGDSAYCASKFAVRGFTEVLQLELASTNVGVSCVLPGKIRTELSKRQRISTGASTPPTAATIERYGVQQTGLTSPEAAADRIVEGIVRGEKRILVGPDAVWVERLQRILPARYKSVLDTVKRVRSVMSYGEPGARGQHGATTT